jgi:hypothetical protein
MSDTEKTVFISYRRDVASFIARAIFMDLRMNGYDVFMDGHGNSQPDCGAGAFCADFDAGVGGALY